MIRVVLLLVAALFVAGAGVLGLAWVAETIRRWANGR